MSSITGHASYLSRDMQSVAALAWLDYKESVIRAEFPGGLFYKSNSSLGEKWVGPFKVDGYYELPSPAVGGPVGAVANAPSPGAVANAPSPGAVANAPSPGDRAVVYEFLGCFYHGCNTCFTDSLQMNPKTRCTMGQLRSRTLDRLEKLKRTCWRLVYIWECEFKNELLENAELSTRYDFAKQYQPLNPRDAFFGGRTENFKTFWKSKEGDDCHLKYVDICSLYPYVNATCVYPVGHPSQVFVRSELIAAGGDLNQVVSQYFGLVKCKVLAPQNVWLPVLPCRQNGKLIFTLCCECSIVESSTDCRHGEDQRSFWGTFCTPELNLALDKGYMVVDVSEVWHWSVEQQSSDLFKEYIRAFLKAKTEASGWPSHVASSEDEEAYVEEYFEKEGIRLEQSKVVKNEGLRFISKLLLNSFWGYLGMRDNLPQTKYVNSYAEILQTFTSPEVEPMDLYLVNPDVAVVCNTRNICSLQKCRQRRMYCLPHLQHPTRAPYCINIWTR